MVSTQFAISGDFLIRSLSLQGVGKEGGRERGAALLVEGSAPWSLSGLSSALPVTLRGEQHYLHFTVEETGSATRQEEPGARPTSAGGACALAGSPAPQGEEESSRR